MAWCLHTLQFILLLLSRIGFSIKKKFKEEDLYKDRESQIQAIEDTFSASKVEVGCCQSNPSFAGHEIDGFMQKGYNSSTLPMELLLFCINPLHAKFFVLTMLNRFNSVAIR